MSNPLPLPTPLPLPLPAMTVQAGGIEPVPLGSYFAEFLHAELFSMPEKGIEGKIKWQWEVVSGPQKGKLISALTDARITPQTHAGRLLTGMAGRALTVGGDVNALILSFMGKRYLCSHQGGPKGGKPSVQSVSPPPEM